MTAPLLDAENLLDDARDIVECLWMAAAAVEVSTQTEAIQATAACALDKIAAVKEELRKARAEAR